MLLLLYRNNRKGGEYTMQNKTTYTTSRARVATCEEVAEFCQFKLAEIDRFGRGLYAYAIEDLLMKEFPTLVVLDNFFRLGSQYAGRMLMATYVGNTRCIQRFFGWNKDTQKLVLLDA